MQGGDPGRNGSGGGDPMQRRAAMEARECDLCTASFVTPSHSGAYLCECASAPPFLRGILQCTWSRFPLRTALPVPVPMLLVEWARACGTPALVKCVECDWMRGSAGFGFVCGVWHVLRPASAAGLCRRPLPPEGRRECGDIAVTASSVTLFFFNKGCRVSETARASDP